MQKQKKVQWIWTSRKTTSIPGWDHIHTLFHCLTHSIPCTDKSQPAIMAVAVQVRLYPHTASHYIAIVLIWSKSLCSQLSATTTSWMHQHNVALTCWQFSTGPDTHVNLSELLQNSWSEAESILNTAGAKWVKRTSGNVCSRGVWIQCLSWPNISHLWQGKKWTWWKILDAVYDHDGQ